MIPVAESDFFRTGTKQKTLAEPARGCTRSRNRTGTALLLLVFETSASTYSAIRAFSLDDGSANIEICSVRTK